jgi:eukaryotic-like serine/threonine-protein kinase
LAIACPYCAHRLTVRAGAPGRYRPKCPNCAQPFHVQFSTDPNAPPVVKPLAAKTQVRAADAPPSDADGAFVVADPGTNRGESDVFGRARPEPTHDSPGPDADSHAAEQTARINLAPRPPISGYQIERVIGRGGMGTVYLAKQLSLDRHVALKVMSKRWATDPVFVARFTREAFAAAQLSHPNIVQIHDIGEAEGARFFSMEYVRGESLADLVRRRGKLDAETAVGYILQAARGLKHAHDRGMIHRDVKPDNLLLDDQGLIKVADLGLVKTPTVTAADDQLTDASSRSGLLSLPPEMTGARIALGTPAYMSPEQCRDAATVDHRADIYSLGCTLYVLVTGRPPFDGTTAVELMSKHAYDPLVPPEQIVSRVPKELSAVIQRMMAKDASDRYADMGEVIRTLEAWLGIHHAGTFSPHDEQIERLEGYVQQFNACGPAVLRSRLISGFFGAVALAAVLLAFFGKLGWSFGVFGLALQAALAYFLIDGATRGGRVFTAARRLVRGMTLFDLGVSVAAFGMFCMLLALSQVFWIWVLFGIIGVALALTLRYAIDPAIAAERKPALDGCEKLLKRMRARGLDEEALRLFVAKFAGRNWEEFFEAQFGFDAKLAARGVLLRGGMAGEREKHAAWREPLIAWMERVETARREAKQKKLLASVERANLLAAGASASSADQHAQAAADAMVRAAGEARDANAPVANVARAAEHPEEFAFVPRDRRDPLGKLIGLFVGPHVRAVCAAILLAACGLWAHQNGLLPGSEIRAQATEALEKGDLSALQSQAALDATRATKPLAVPGVPPALTSWVDSFNVGLAGLMLLGSLCFRGNLMSVLALVGAAVAVVGHQFGIRAVEPFRAYHVSLMLGALLALVGFRMGTR